MSLFLTLLVVVAFPILAIVLVVKRAKEVQALSEHGRVTRGFVVARIRRARPRGTGRNMRVKLKYERPDTGEHSRWISVFPSEWQRLPEGADVDIVYLPEKPGVFALKALIDEARAAKGLGPL